MIDTKELSYLESVLEELNQALELLNQNIERQRQRARKERRRFDESSYELDAGQIHNVRQWIGASIENYSKDADQSRLLARLQISPYFGKIEFLPDGEEIPRECYIGLSNFSVPGRDSRLIYDWRSHTCSMFYDSAPGPVTYETLRGPIEGVLQTKKHFRIRDGELQYVYEGGPEADTAFLLRELGLPCRQRGKAIAATIQKEQNAVIRDETTRYLAIMGTAGSGKTSAALHRVAFLLYRNRKLHASDVLVLSPNPLFSSHIASVLPELGEENLLEMSFRDLIFSELKDYACETRSMQLERLLEHPDTKAEILIQFKKSTAFSDKLKAFPEYFAFHYTAFEDLDLFGARVSFRFLEKLFFEKYYSEPVFLRLKTMADFLCDLVETRRGITVSREKRRQVEGDLLSFMRLTELEDIYRAFLKWASVDIASSLPGGRLPNEDVFPMIYLKYRLFGGREFPYIRHLIVDEMQDYSIVQYELLKLMFSCPITFLGDPCQSIDGGNPSAVLQYVFPQMRYLEFQKSYRSTWEITRFSNAILKVPGVIPFERHGDLPTLTFCADAGEERRRLMEAITDCQEQGLTSIAVIFRSGKEASRYARLWREENADAAHFTLVNTAAMALPRGVVLLPSILCKGLEFDAVFIPSLGDAGCSKEMERRLLYIACTRAIHRLGLFTLQEETPASLKSAEGLFQITS